MKKKKAPIVIIGNGVSGNSAASAIRKIDKTVHIIMISKEPYPEYSACVLSKKYISGEMKKDQVFLKNNEDYSNEKIEILLGQRVERIDSKIKLVTLMEKKIKYDKLIIASGGRPIIPQINGVDKHGVFTLKSLDDAEAICKHKGKKAVVIGAGPIGVEAAISLKRRGFQVSLVEMQGWILPSVFDEKPALLLRKIIEEGGIQVFTGERVVEIRGDSRVYSALTNKRKLDCDMVILTLGIRPDVELAKEAGIKIGSLGGITVNQYMQTSIKDIYACGDCIETRDIITGENALSPLWYNAKKQGEIAGFCASGVEKRYKGTMTVSCIDVLGVKAVSIGHTEEKFGDTALTAVEKNNGYYHRLLISDGFFVGVQYIGRTENVGILHNIMRKGYSLERIQRILNDRSLLSRSPWYYRLCSELIM